MALPSVIVTNFKRRITGVTTTAINVTTKQKDLADLPIGLCGPHHEWRLWQVFLYGWARPKGHRHRIWHVRRNAEMAWGLFAKHILRQPIKMVFTSAAIRRHSAYPRWLISQMDAVVATSQVAADLVPNTTLIQPHGVDIQTFKPGKKTAALSIAFIGRIRPEKGVHILIDALCQVLTAYPKVQVYMIGQTKAEDRAFQKEQQAKLMAAGIQQQVTWYGEIPAEDVAALLAKSHILAATPLYEGYGLTAIEGLASGCAVLLSDTGIFAEATAQGQTGTLVPLDDPIKTAAALSNLLADPVALGKKQKRAREIAETHFSIEYEAKTYLQLYRDLSQAAKT